MNGQTQGSFEERLAAIEKIAGELENGQLGLEASLQQYETGMKWLGELEKELNQARQRLTMIRKDQTGNMTEIPVRENERGVEPVTGDDLPF